MLRMCSGFMQLTTGAVRPKSLLNSQSSFVNNYVLWPVMIRNSEKKKNFQFFFLRLSHGLLDNTTWYELSTSVPL